MKAVVASQIGPYADVLSLCSVPKPELAPGTALVRVLSAGLAFPDVLVVEGKVRPQHRASSRRSFAHILPSLSCPLTHACGRRGST